MATTATLPLFADSPHYDETHQALHAGLVRFVERELRPHVDAWEEAGAFPRALYRRAAEVGLIGVGFPEALGGSEGDVFHRIVATEALSRAGSGGLAAGLMSHAIGLPPVLALASDALKAEVAPPILAGEAISALAVTEPGGGSDVANLKTRAERRGDDYVLTGEKTFITSGMRADWITMAVRTGGEGIGGVSILCVPGDAPGLTRTPIRKMGWWCSDTATLHMDGCRVPARYLVGEEGEGFFGLMANFNGERLMLASMAWAFGLRVIEEALGWAGERETFGRPLLKRQVVRHMLLDMIGRTAAVRALLETTAWQSQQAERGLLDPPIAELCLLKNEATAALERTAGEAVQLLGGAGYTRGTVSERVFRESKVLSIGGGASEVLKDLAARQLGW